MEWTYIVEFSAGVKGLAGDLHKGAQDCNIRYSVLKYYCKDLNMHK